MATLINQAKSSEITICPNCKTKKPTITINVNIDASGTVYAIFNCCAIIWTLHLLEVGTLISKFEVPNPNKST